MALRVVIAEIGTLMIPLYRDPHFTFRFLDDRIVSRFHLDGAPAGARVTIALTDADHVVESPIISATVGADGWVDVADPIRVSANRGFIVTLAPEPT